MTSGGRLRRGDVVLVDLDPVVGHETGRRRPAILVQNDIGNRYSPTVIVVAITSYDAKKATYPICVTLEAGEGGLEKRSIANASQIRTIDARRIAGGAGGEPLGKVGAAAMAELDRALMVSLALERA